ncbi:CARDB domain-containing protein, partial [Nocardioides sp.]|uniref:CARDB domain-containing protein n=1 Tax=Nocardioides sp. TaxID=35761 RepID=UPI002D7F96F3
MRQHAHPLARAATVAALATAVVMGGVTTTPASAEDATVTAVGRFVYVDDGGNIRGIRNARVEMCDEEFPGCSWMATGQTDANGNFSLTGRAGDFLFDMPDPLVKVIADSPAGVVQTSGAVNSTYCFQSGFRDNATNGSTQNFGEISPDSGVSCDVFHNQTDNDDGAWQVFTNLGEVRDFMNPHTQATSGRDVPKVRAFWPEVLDRTFYRGPVPLVDEGGISVAQGATWNEGVVYHEYGHHVLQHFAESPMPDYNNGNCDGTFFFEAGHCMWLSEKGFVHWTEGFPDFLGEVVARAYGKDTTISSVYGNLEDLPHPAAHADPDHANTEGYTAAILLDAWDGVRTGEDHDGNGSRDRLDAGFGAIWNVVDTYDPKPFDGGWNHVRTIDQFLEGFDARNPGLASRLAEVYDENHLPGRQAMDLSVGTASFGSPSVVRGRQLSVTDTTRNVGVTRVGESSQTAFWLSTDAGRGPDDIRLGTRGVPDLLPAGGSSTGTVPLTVPPGTPAGSYSLLACADGDGALFESNEANNCAVSATKVVVQVQRADLESRSPSGLPGTVLRGGSFSLTDVLANTGDAEAGPSTTRFALSADATPGGDLPLAGTRSVGTVLPGATTSASVSVTVPGGTAPGVYRVVACADSTGAVTEWDETDNCAVSTATLQVTAPNLRVTALSNPPSSVVRGRTMQVQDSTRNVGLAPAGTSVTRYRLSLDGRLSAGDVLLAGERSVTALAAGATATGSKTVRVPTSMPVGTYRLLACADDTHLVSEGSESDNCRASTF